jgi:hypothetical protein
MGRLEGGKGIFRKIFGIAAMGAGCASISGAGIIIRPDFLLKDLPQASGGGRNSAGAGHHAASNENRQADASCQGHEIRKFIRLHSSVPKSVFKLHLTTFCGTRNHFIRWGYPDFCTMGAEKFLKGLKKLDNTTYCIIKITNTQYKVLGKIS